MQEEQEEEGDEGERGLRATPDRAVADEWLLVLAAEGFRPSIRHEAGAFVASVPDTEHAAALRVLEHYDDEQRGQVAPRPAAEPIGVPDLLAGLAFAAAILAFFAVTGPRDAASPWFGRGAADADAILSGELWRTVTALSLHADWGHVIANALFGAVFGAAAAAGYGPGIALALSLLAGAGGNLANAIFHGPGHVSVGASTAVFAAVGLLGARGVAHRLGRGESGLQLWVPFAAGLALIAMLGTGEGSDVWAHGFGFVTGAFLGIPASLAWPRPAAWPVQTVACAAAVLALVESWRLAGS